MNAPLDSRSSREDDERAEVIVSVALSRPEGDRGKYLDDVCGTDEGLRKLVDQLLERHALARGFMEQPAVFGPNCPDMSLLLPEEAGSHVGPYRLLQQIGEGGFGVVWMAEQERPIRRRVALKIVKLGMDTREVVARFEQERQALAVMDHSNIAKVFDAGATPTGRPYFAMELVRGVKITEYCDEARLSTEQRLRLFLDVCRAVQHAHQKGIIHRDLKPSNVLVTLHDGVPVPKVIDFGIAKATQQLRLTDITLFTQFQQMIGTPLYMAPEQAELSGLDIDTRSDIYSLGVLLYELMIGRTPFDPDKLKDSGHDEIRRVIREQEPLRPSTVLATMAQDRRATLARNRGGAEGAKLINTVRGDIDWIVMKALEKDRNRRYATANELALDIERHLKHEPIQARPPTAGYRFRRFVRRNRASSAAAVVALLAIVVSVVAVAVMVWRIDRENARANAEASNASAALGKLRASAPAFVAMAKTRAQSGRLAEAVENLDVAIELKGDSVEYRMAKANLLESQMKFSEAASAYEEVVILQPRHAVATAHAAMCKRFAAEMDEGAKISRESLTELLSVMSREQRPAEEMLPIGKALGSDNEILLRHWRERLQSLPIPPGRPLTERLVLTSNGELSLDLSETAIEDLSPLEDMPLAELDLTSCPRVREIRALKNLPLRSLTMSRTSVIDFSVLATLRSLRSLSLITAKIEDLSPLRELPLKSLVLTKTRVTDLQPIRGLPLEYLDLGWCRIRDIDSLRGMPLVSLNIGYTECADLRPLRGMPLKTLICDRIPAADFSPLEGLQLEELSAIDVLNLQLHPISKMPLRRLFLAEHQDVSGFALLEGMKTLEVLGLPYLFELPDHEFNAITRLKHHPSIRSIGAWDEDFEILPRDKFWQKFSNYEERRAVNARVYQLCRERRFVEASRELRDLLDKEIVPKAATWRTWLDLGTVLLAAGQISEYQEVCRHMVATFRRQGAGDRAGPHLALLRPDGGVPISELRRVIPHLAGIRETSRFYCWFLLDAGMLEFRAGNTAEAIRVLSTVRTNEFPESECLAATVLAMAFGQSGDARSARDHLERAKTIKQTFWPDKIRKSWGMYWVQAGVLIEEAENLLKL